MTVTLTDGRTVTGSHCLLAVGSIPNTADMGSTEAGVDPRQRRLHRGRQGVADLGPRRLRRRRLHRGADAGLGGGHAGPDRHVARARRRGRAAGPQDRLVQRLHRPGDRHRRDEPGSGRLWPCPRSRRSTCRCSGNARAKMQGFRDGFVKVFCLPVTGIVVGGVVVAPRASELIFPLAIAVAQRLTVDQSRPARSRSIPRSPARWPRRPAACTGPAHQLPSSATSSTLRPCIGRNDEGVAQTPRADPLVPSGRDRGVGDRQAAAVADLLRGRTWTALTGAGMSTDSGIPDYRGPTSIRATPMQFGEFVRSSRGPAALLGPLLPGLAADRPGQPNAGHRALVDLEPAGLVGIITQNVDGLHQRRAAGRCQPARRDRLGGLPGLRRPPPRPDVQRRLTELNPDAGRAAADRARRAAPRRRRGGARTGSDFVLADCVRLRWAAQARCRVLR